MTIPTQDMRWLILRDTLDASESTVDPIQVILLLEQGNALVRQLLGEVVHYARAEGHTWADIGKALGVTKQGAWLRFAGDTTYKGQD